MANMLSKEGNHSWEFPKKGNRQKTKRPFRRREERRWRKDFGL